MARQRIHNSRSGTGAGNAGASWISYSDMMAALLLVFVLILSVSLYEYFTMLETTQAELTKQEQQLADQQHQLSVQQSILLDQQAQLDDQTMQLAAQQVTLDNQNAMIIIMQGDLKAQQIALDEANRELAASQAELDHAYVLLGQRESELAEAQQALAIQQEEFRQQTLQLGNMVGVRADIIGEISTALSRRGVRASVDPNTGDIVISSKMLTFKTNSAELTPESKAFLDTFVPAYLDVLLRPEYADYLGTIVIEGHTDMTGSYERNMELSQERALSVLLYIRSMYADDPVVLARLDQILVCTGKGYSDPIYYEYGGQRYVDQDASRRVEFKFTLRDAEMIEELNRIINGP